MGDSRKADYEKYEMAPTTDPEKGGAEMTMEDESKEAEWTGLGKEELLRVANTPTWNWSRNILLILFWVAWVAMLVAAIVIVVKVPRCPEVEWWEKSPIYQVFPRSFRDSDGDGVGDLKGVKDEISYLSETLGVNVLYLNSIYEQPSTTTDIGYDIIDFTNVDPILGNLTDFDELLAALAEKDIKLILEFVPNHSSDQHPWFVDSKKSRDSMYSDYYIWANATDASGTQPPNEWKNEYGDSAWTYVAEREQFYYHHYLPSQPDFNYNNASLNKDIMGAMQFWLDRKVDGFVFTNIDYLVEPQTLKSVLGGDVSGAGARRRRQATNSSGTTSAPAAATEAATTAETTKAPAVPDATEQPEPEPGTMKAGGGMGGAADPSDPYSSVGEEQSMATKAKLGDVLQEWRNLLVQSSHLGKYRLMVTQSKYDLDFVISQYWRNESYLADFPLNLGLVDVLKGSLSGAKIYETVDQFMKAKDAIGTGRLWSTWTLGNNDVNRVATRVNKKYVNALNMLLMTLPGTPVPYYGDELGVEDITIATCNDVVDPVAKMFPPAKCLELTRDPERAPLPWSSEAMGGFSTGNTTWLPLPDNYEEVNVEAQKADKMSSLNLFKALSGYHVEPSINAGEFIKVEATESVLAYVRAFPDWPRYLVAMNLGSADVTRNFHTALEDVVPMTGRVVVATSEEKANMEKELPLDMVKLMPGEAVLVEFPRA